MSDQNESRQPDTNEDSASTNTIVSDAGVGPLTLQSIRLLRDHITAGEATHAEVMDAISREESNPAPTEASRSRARALDSVRYSLRPITLPDGETGVCWWPTREEDVEWFERQPTWSIAGFEFLSRVLDPSNPLISGYLASTTFPELNAVSYGVWSLFCKLTADRGTAAIVDSVLRKEWEALRDAQSSIGTNTENASNDTDEAKGEANGEPSM